MNYCILLAGGSGTRMGQTEVPKQFMLLKDEPIIIRSIKNVLKCNLIGKIIIACHKNYIEYLKEMLQKYNLQDKAEVTEGGANRLMSAYKGIMCIKEKYGIRPEDIIVAHDSVRMFTKERIFRENIENAQKYGAATTVYYLEETVLKAGDDGLLNKAYPRENRYTGQSPQTFNIAKFLDCFNRLQEDQKNTFTDLAEVLYVNNEKVYPVIGDKDNIKITTPFDLILAELRLDNNKE